MMSMLPGNGFDLLALIVILFCVLTSLWRGAMVELFGLIGWIGSFLVARLYAEGVAHTFFSSLEPAFLRTGVAWTSIFICCLLTAGLLGNFFKNLFSKAGLSPVDRAIGAVLGAIKGFVLLLVLVWFGGYTPLAKSELYKNSVAVRSCQQVIEVVRQHNSFGTATDTSPAHEAPSKPQPNEPPRKGEPSLKLPAPKLKPASTLSS